MFLLSKYEIEEGLIPTKLYNGIILLSKCLLSDNLLKKCCELKGLATLTRNPCSLDLGFKKFDEEEASSTIKNYAQIFKIPNDIVSSLCGKSIIGIKQDDSQSHDDAYLKIKNWRDKIEATKFEPTNWKALEMRNQFPLLLRKPSWKIQEMEISGINNLVVNLQAIAVSESKTINENPTYNFK